MKLREIIRFELACQVRRVTPWLCFAVLFVFAFVLMGVSTPTDDDQLIQSPYGIAFFTVLGGAIWLLIAAPVAGEAAARDVQARMHPLTYTAPVSRAQYLCGRFLAAFVLNAVLLLAVPAGLLLALLLSDADPSRLGPFRPAAYLTAYGLIALPFAFAATAIQFSCAALSRRPMAAYLAGVLLLITSSSVPWVAARLLGRLELVPVLDLVGIGGIILHLGDAWTPAEKNTRLVGLDGTLLVNRLIWIIAAGGVLAFTYARFRLAHPAEGTPGRWTRGTRDARRGDARAGTPAGKGIAPSAPVTVPRVRRAFGFTTHARQTLGIAGASFRALAKSPGGWILLAVVPALVVVLLPQNVELFGVPLRPRTGYVLTLLTAPLTNPFTPWTIIPLLIVLYAGELVWRERDAGLSDITDAAPVPEWAVLLGKFLGLALLLAAWTALLAAAGMLVQARMGYHDFETGLYLKVLFGLQLPEYLLFALLALVLQALVNQKYLGLLVSLVAYGSIAFASTLGIGHHLLVYGSAPAWSYTDIRGFGPSLGPWIWFKLYWAAWALLLAIAAGLLRVRGRDAGPGARLRGARRRFTRRTAGAAAGAAGLVVALGGFIVYNTHVLNAYTTAEDGLARRAAYERRYGRYADVPQPRLAGTSLHVEIHPARRAVDIRGTFHLVNRGTASIPSIHLATDPEVETDEVTLDRPAARVLADESLGHRIYALRRPLQPGESLRLRFAVHVRPRGFRNGGADASVAANGTFFTNESWLPTVGYRAERELRRAGDRRAHGLPPRPFFRSLDDAVPLRDPAGRERFAFEAVVGTDADQVAVAPGALRGTWTNGGRRYFRYVTDAPIGRESGYGIFSARYAVREARWRDVAIRIFHHPAHTANLDRMVRGVQASLEHYTEQFGPYPYRHLTLAEAPGMGGMTAEASLITFQEGFSLFHPEADARSPDFPFTVVAHEVAHQWWGSHLTPPRVEGTPLLSESLAEYAAFQVLRKTYGPEPLRRYLARLRTQYDVPRARAGVPLLRAGDDFHQYYKGPFALYALGEYVGEARVNRALRRLQEAHASGALLTTLDLHRELRAVTPDSLRYLLRDLWEANTFWELRTEAATAARTPTGAWRVTLRVRARKVTVDTAGRETEVPMDDWIPIGVFAPAGEGGARGEALHLRMHRVRSGPQTITVTVPHRPARAGIDPHHLLFDLERADNVAEVKTGS